MVGTVQDITEAKLLDEAKTDFVGLASHQLRTPATGVKQYIGMLQSGMVGKMTPDQEKLLRIADECNERQLAVINDLLRVAQVDSGHIKLKRVRTDLVVLVQAVAAEQAQLNAATKQVITVSATHKQVIYPIDVRRFRMVLENLIGNAYKYTLPGKNIAIRLTKRSNRMVISIKDEGVGIAPEDISRLFGKFSRIDNPVSIQVGGTGLGLYWANKLVMLHGGKMEVRSKQNVGSEFRIILPLHSKSKK
jgi:signal transduction histidine kinase